MKYMNVILILSTQFKSSLKSKIAAATKVEASKINVAQKKTWVETVAKKITAVEASKEGTTKEQEEKAVISTTVAPNQKEEKAEIIATNKTPEEKKDITTTVAPKSHIQGEKKIIETKEKTEKADTTTKAPVVKTKKSGEWQDICKAGLGYFSQESLDSQWLQTLKFADKDGDERISFYEFFRESEGVSKTEACFKRVKTTQNPGHAEIIALRKLCHKIEEVWNKYAGNDGKLDRAQKEKFSTMLLWEGMYDTITATEEPKPSASTASEGSTGPTGPQKMDPVPEETGPTGPAPKVEEPKASTASSSSTASSGSAGASASAGSTANDEAILESTTSPEESNINPSGEKQESVPATSEPQATQSTNRGGSSSSSGQSSGRAGRPRTVTGD